MRIAKTNLIKCPCCYHLYIDKDNLMTNSICPFCYWEDDNIEDENTKSSVNECLTIKDYRDKYKLVW